VNVVIAVVMDLMEIKEKLEKEVLLVPKVIQEFRVELEFQEKLELTVILDYLAHPANPVHLELLDYQE
jgi:hypothetical protein